MPTSPAHLAKRGTSTSKFTRDNLFPFTSFIYTTYKANPGITFITVAVYSYKRALSALQPKVV